LYWFKIYVNSRLILLKKTDHGQDASVEIGGAASVALGQGRQGQTLRRAGVAALNGGG